MIIDALLKKNFQVDSRGVYWNPLNVHTVGPVFWDHHWDHANVVLYCRWSWNKGLIVHKIELWDKNRQSYNEGGFKIRVAKYKDHCIPWML